ncbi:MAG: zinc ribbon domain-containing protein, partial [Gemmatimonadetes bacterium]|nr:zinc ribbon domain-containing protein [Gemmatimonadota bacterium]
MPIYEYHCSTCGADFEALVSPSRPAACPTCAGVALERKL